MPIQPDYSTWFTKEQAAQVLNISTKQVERLAKGGTLVQVKWKRPAGGQPIVVYRPEDVEKVAGTHHPFVVHEPPTPSNGHGLQRQTERPADGAGLQAFVGLLQQLSEQSQQSQTVYLTLEQAARFTGLSLAYLRRACQAGEVPAKKDGGWKIRRTALAAL